MESKKVLMFPWLAHGHISPFVELAKRLADKNFTIYLCSSKINLQNIKPKLPDHYSSSIELVELEVPSFPDLPPHFHTTNGLPFHLKLRLFEAFDMSAPHFSTILQRLNPDLLISDILQPWAAEIASSFNIPTYTFYVVGIASASYGIYFTKNPGFEFPFPRLAESLNHLSLKKKIPDPPAKIGVKSIDERRLECLHGMDLSPNPIIVNTFTEIESKYIDFVSMVLKKKIIPVGPLIQKVSSENEKPEIIIQWLDKKKPKSTVYVSFGSEFYLPKEDLEGLAHGLELSGANFIWVVRFPKEEKTTMEEALPEGFLERVGERGMIIEWAPQMKILAHPSVGGFVCHCGWNSLLESMAFGVPIIALPMQLDQPWHAVVAEEAGFCVEAKRDNEGNVRREEVAKAIKEVVFEETGERLRNKAREISQVVKKKAGGTIDGFMDEINQVFEAKKKQNHGLEG